MEKPQKKGPRAAAETSWNAVASWYDDLLQPENDTYQKKVVLPNLMRLLAPDGKRVIDIACGQGFFSEAALNAGAREVYGIDIAPELVEFAHKRIVPIAETQNKRAAFEVAPAHQITKAPAAAFDAGMIVLALQNIKEMPETLAEAARVLTPGGSLVIVLNHPAFRIPKASSWGFDEAAGVQYRRVDHYGKPFSVAMEMNPGAPADEKIHTASFHRPLQDYFKALSKAGFSVTALEEWNSHKESEPGPRAKAENEARAEFPLFLTIVARRN
jgi:ubiquinone/menaquinone biosynthesis C-methylase UbiE